MVGKKEISAASPPAAPLGAVADCSDVLDWFRFGSTILFPKLFGLLLFSFLTWLSVTVFYSMHVIP